MQNVVSKLICGTEIYYNRELDIIRATLSDIKCVNSDNVYARTIPDGIYDTCFEITTKCNQFCRNCFAYSLPENGEEMNYKDIETLIAKREDGRIRIGITGGEPFLHSEIQKIIQLPNRFKKLNFMISTNGNFELTPEMEKNLVIGNWLITISIHGNKKTHNLYTKSESFDTVLINLSKLSKKLIVHTYTVVNRFMTKDDIDFIIDLQAKYRIFYTRFIIPRDVGRVDFQYDDSLVEYILEKVKDNEKAGIKKDFSHTELVDVKLQSRIIG